MSARAPRVSVILPAYYSDATIGACLCAIAAQTWRDCEVIVVNSSPEERTRQIVATQFPSVIFRQHSARLLPHAARNLGIALARGELFVFTDPDCLPRPDWLAHLVGASEQAHEILVGGMEIKNGTWVARGIHLCKWFWLLSHLPPRSPWLIATGNACISRRAMEATGRLDGELYNGDALWGWRARAKGFQLWFEPRAVVEQIHQQSVVELLGERYARGKEFARMRAEYEHWSRWRAIGYVLASPALLAIVLGRTFRCALVAGWLISFLATLSITILGQMAWVLGESRSYLAYAFFKSNLPSHLPTAANMLNLFGLGLAASAILNSAPK